LVNPRGSSETLRMKDLFPRRSMRLIYSFVCVCAAMQAAAVDSIWTARYVVTMDAQRRVIENGAIAVTGDHIVAVGTRARSTAITRRRSVSTGPTRF